MIRGLNVRISPKASIYGTEMIEIGDNVRIDDFCILSGGRGLKIGSNVHIGAHSSLFAGSGIEIADFCQFAAYCVLLSESDDFSGRSLIGPCIPRKYKPGYKTGKIVLERHVVFGVGCVAFPGVRCGEGAAFGAGTIINRDADPWTLYAGSPMRSIKPRSKEMIALGDEFEMSQKG